MNGDWQSYDAIAETYARVAEGPYFATPGQALLSLLHLTPGSRLLDVGTGTGIVAALAADIVGPGGLVVGLDPAIGPLHYLKRRCRATVLAGALPYLPLQDSSFDAVAAAFVLSHVADHASALKEMVATLRPAGRLAVSAWARSESGTPPGTTWQTVVREFMNEEDIQVALGRAAPCEKAFSDPILLRAALADAGLRQIEVRQLTYSIELATQSFVEVRMISLAGRYMKSVLAAPHWKRFIEEVSRRLATSFGSHVCFEVQVNLAAGARPSTTQ